MKRDLVRVAVMVLTLLLAGVAGYQWAQRRYEPCARLLAKWVREGENVRLANDPVLTCARNDDPILALTTEKGNTEWRLVVMGKTLAQTKGAIREALLKVRTAMPDACLYLQVNADTNTTVSTLMEALALSSDSGYASAVVNGAFAGYDCRRLSKHGPFSPGTIVPGGWQGVYTSPAEIRGFSGTVFVLLCERDGTVSYRKAFYSDDGGPADRSNRERMGQCLIVGESLFVPESSAITRYTRVQIGGRTVLMRDDALNAYHIENKLYDYGILIRVSDYADSTMDITKAKHESIKILYQDKTRPWADPFVKGPNKR